MRERAAWNPMLSASAISKSIESDDIAILKGISTNTALTNSQIEMLMANEQHRGTIYRRLAGNPATPESALIHLAKWRDGDTRGSVARRKHAPEHILDILANDTKEDVRDYVACNSTAPTRLLAKLANDPEARVRAAVAKNPITPVEILRKLNQMSPRPVYSLAWNPATPTDILESLSYYTDNSDVRCAALLNLATNGQMPSI